MIRFGTAPIIILAKELLVDRHAQKTRKNVQSDSLDIFCHSF